jgi:putative FmdB family regulatory protein
MFEVRQRMTDDPLTECPKCGEETVRRVINNVGIVFKGKGFYVTDSRNGRSATISSNGDSSTGSSTNGSDSDAKAEKKSETTKSEKVSTEK